MVETGKQFPLLVRRLEVLVTADRLRAPASGALRAATGGGNGRGDGKPLIDAVPGVRIGIADLPPNRQAFDRDGVTVRVPFRDGRGAGRLQKQVHRRRVFQKPSQKTPVGGIRFCKGSYLVNAKF